MPYIGYVVILTICATVGLVAYGRISERYHAAVLYISAAAMVLMTTLAGPYLVGSDIHLEYYYAQLRNGGDVWQPVVGIPQGSSILSYISSSIWTYKLVYPLIYSLVPVVLYLIYQKWIDRQKAFLATFLFIAFPAFFMEIPTIPRQAVAEVVLVIAFYLIINSTWRLMYKMPTLALCAVLMTLIHYSIGIIALIVFSVALIVSIVNRQGMWKPIIIVLAVIVAVGGAYFSYAEDGAVKSKVVNLWNAYAPDALSMDVPKLVIPSAPTQDIVPSVVQDEIASPNPAFSRYSLLMQTALGMDIMTASGWGKAFRILQLCMVLCLAVGLWKLRKNKNYWVFASGALLITALCLIPGWASILNVTRFAHLSLFILAPAFAVVASPKYMVVPLIAYFLFTSGLVFEAAKYDDIEEYEVPYSIALSDHRMDLGATFTSDDVAVRDYIVTNNLFPLHSDIYGADFIGESIGLRGDINWSLPKTGRPLADGYIYLRSRNVQDDSITVWWGIGLRRYATPAEYKIDFDSNLVYQSGDARVIKYDGVEW